MITETGDCIAKRTVALNSVDRQETTAASRRRSSLASGSHFLKREFPLGKTFFFLGNNKSSHITRKEQTA